MEEVYHFQIRKKGAISFETIAQFYSNPINESIFLLGDVILENFKHKERAKENSTKDNFTIDIDFSDYKFIISYDEFDKRKNRVYEFRYFKDKPLEKGMTE